MSILGFPVGWLLVLPVAISLLLGLPMQFVTFAIAFTIHILAGDCWDDPHRSCGGLTSATHLTSLYIVSVMTLLVGDLFYAEHRQITHVCLGGGESDIKERVKTSVIIHFISIVIYTIIWAVCYENVYAYYITGIATFALSYAYRRFIEHDDPKYFLIDDNGQRLIWVYLGALALVIALPIYSSAYTDGVIEDRSNGNKIFLLFYDLWSPLAIIGCTLLLYGVPRHNLWNTIWKGRLYEDGDMADIADDKHMSL